MTLVTAMPSVRESNDQPVELEVVEVRPGVFLKLNETDRKAHAAAQAAEAERRAAWDRINAGEPAAADPDTAEQDADEVPKPRTRKK